MRNFLEEMLNNNALWVAVLSWAAAQAIKVIIDFSRHKKIDKNLFVSSGGMPSSHSSFVVALSTAIAINEGFSSSIFAVSAVLSAVVMYDAAGVRRAAGKQAEILNELIESLENTGVKLDKKLKELLGHTPIEVAAGALLGIIIAYLFA